MHEESRNSASSGLTVALLLALAVTLHERACCRKRSRRKAPGLASAAGVNTHVFGRRGYTYSFDNPENKENKLRIYAF